MSTCYVRGCGRTATAELELHIGNNDMIIVLLCTSDYRQAWDVKSIPISGGTEFD